MEKCTQLAEEAAKRLLPDLNLEREAKKAERVGIGVAKRLRWYKQTYGQNVVQQATSMNSNPWWQPKKRAQGLPVGRWWTNWLNRATYSFVTTEV